jgi:hypothetical protein
MFAVLALPGARGATGDSIKTVSDKVGDTIEEKTKAPMNEPRGDAVEAVVDYGLDGLTMKMKVAKPVKPRPNNDWQYSGTGIGWLIDTDGADFTNPEFSVEYGLDQGNIYADVFRRGVQNPVCQGTASTAPTRFSSRPPSSIRTAPTWTTPSRSTTCLT